MTEQVALLVDVNATRRGALARALGEQAIRVVEVADPFEAMGALGREAFTSMVVVGEQKRLSLRGLCLLAHKWHPRARIVVLGEADVDAESLTASVGVPVEVHVLGDSARTVAARIARCLSLPGEDPWSLDTMMVTLAVQEARSDESSAAVSFEGAFEPGAGAALLLGLFAQELTGRLVVHDGPAAGVLCFLAGQPVWAIDARGDVGLWERLARTGLLPRGLKLDDVPEGALLSALAREKRVPRAKLLELCRDFVRDRTLAALAPQHGSYAFIEEHTLVDVMSMVRIDPFGVVLERRRRDTPPEKLLAKADQLGACRLVPGGAFPALATKLSWFKEAPGRVELVMERPLAAEFCHRSGLGPLMGTLTLLALEDARLVQLTRDADAAPVVAEIAPAPPPSTSPSPVDLPEAPPAAASIEALYFELRGLTDPADVLSVDEAADDDEITTKADALLARLDPGQIGEGPDAHIHHLRLTQLRQKVLQARDALLRQRTRSATESEASAAGERFGRYEIVRPLGRGGMAEVFLGRQIGLEGFEKPVAIKRILPELASDAGFVDMLLNEARVAAALAHPNVVQTLDLGKAGADFYIVFEYVRGWNLQTVLKHAERAGMQMPTAAACTIGSSVLAGLRAAHLHVDVAGKPSPIIHRDVSPHNVLVSTDGFIKLSDFGVARAKGSGREGGAEVIRGKVLYLSPDIVRGQPADEASDTFAAALVLYRCLAGRHPFSRPTAQECLKAVAVCEVPPLPSVRPDVPPALAALLERALSPRPEERFSTAADLETALGVAIAGTVEPGSAGTLARWLHDVFRNDFTELPLTPAPVPTWELTGQTLSVERDDATPARRGGA